MNIRSIFIIFFTIILIVMCCNPIIEGMKGCRKGSRGGRRGGRRGLQRNIYNWYGGGYTTIYDGMPYYWGGWRGVAPSNIYDYYPAWIYRAMCKTGCGYLGNGVVGCVNPTNTHNSCIFASDCYGC